MQILNQMTETHRVRDLAEIVAAAHRGEVDFIENPRNEAEENDLAVENRRLLTSASIRSRCRMACCTR